MIGTRLSHYEILKELGAGGMGVVYRARDTRLGRDVAIKLLPEALARDSERLSRFEREARLLASLNHPNVATLHGLEETDDQRFLVMELVEGETLAERIARGPLAIDEAVSLFDQIAEALEAAHQQDIIHRDLKPANVKITPGGKVKVLDFGLAKLFRAAPGRDPQTESPTITRDATETGVILGTAAYMSPEQARGDNLDKRTDIWSFGCCLFEALTGRSAFLGQTVSDTIAAILKTEPDWSELPSGTPPRLREVIALCLAKVPERRLHDMADARILMARALQEPPETLAEHANRERRSSRIPIAVIVLAGFVALWSLTRGGDESTREVTRSVLPLPPGSSLVLDAAPSVAISPNGRYVAYATESGGATRLHLRALDQLEPRTIEGSDGAHSPIFSPDSQWLGFEQDRKLKKLSLSGGAAITVADLRENAYGTDWGENGIVVARDMGAGIYETPESGDERRILTEVDRERREKTHRLPQALPGGSSVLFTLARSTTESYDDAFVAALQKETGSYRIVLEGGAQARYSPTGHLVYARDGALLAVAFDAERLRTTGRPVPVVSGVVTSPILGTAQFDLSDNGALVYARGSASMPLRKVLWVDRDGNAESLIEEPRAFTAPRLSPDGRHVAFQIHGGIDSIWLYDIERATLTRWTSEWDNGVPVWSPSGREIAFTSSRAGQYNLYRKSVDGTGEAHRLAPSDLTQIPTSWSPDGKILAFHEGGDIWMLLLDGESKPKPFVHGRATETRAMFSPDGRWIAYQSDESGRFEIYVRRFPDGSAKQQVSSDGGTRPAWSPAGGELFYQSGNRMMAVDIETEGDLVLGRPTELFAWAFSPGGFNYFDVAPDGQRFVFLGELELDPPTHLVLVQNFDEELKRVVPAGN